MQHFSLQVYRAVSALRDTPAVLFGSSHFHVSGPVLMLNRVRKGNPGYLLAVNLGSEAVSTNATALPHLPEKGMVQVRSVHEKSLDDVAPGTDLDPEAAG